MSRKRIIFRADGNSSIGMGHFVRTLALAEMLKDDFYCIYATCSPSAYQIKEINRVCDERMELPEGGAHFDVFLSLLKGDEIVVLDNYFFDTAYQELIKSKGCKLVCIDDKHHQPYVCDLIINHTPLTRKEDYYTISNETKYAFGLEYALLRAPFLDASKMERCTDDKAYFVCFGGSDYNNLSLQVLKVLDKLPELQKVNIVTGAAHQNKEEVEAFCNERSNFHHYSSLSAEEMVQVMQECTTAIVPASSILIEVLAVGLYPVIGYFVDNQEEAAGSFVKMGLAISVGDLNAELDPKLREVLDAPLNRDIGISIKKQRVIFSQVKRMVGMKFKELDC